MKQTLSLLFVSTIILACQPETSQNSAQSAGNPLIGTWRLVKGTLIEKGDTLVTDYTKQRSFIKVINETHFAFLLHDLAKGQDSTAVFTAGGGPYSLKDKEYTEHLEYCSDRGWEGHDFPFTITISQDTLVQQGVEKVEKAGIDRINIEQYVKVKK
ncbi:hypothetical protein DYU11_28825 [Fibrisoma montanum]|uniref:Lipocalin-like domain-containing protein n=1 Tax=Fibrisoma montanum TaxID=2305895 RepID=A0A418LXZ4_9BACT|nr:hypothetical protein [Fibrisoma montanum]RIV18246.1 hypothetical protein DYU11_28825 [Fibrisoma montanum]